MFKLSICNILTTNIVVFIIRSKCFLENISSESYILLKRDNLYPLMTMVSHYSMTNPFCFLPSIIILSGWSNLTCLTN